MALKNKLSEVKGAEDIQASFKEVANILLNKGKLVIGGKELSPHLNRVLL